MTIRNHIIPERNAYANFLLTNEEQQALLGELLDNIKESLLRHASEWPPEWDGYELRWLLEYVTTELFNGRIDRRCKRYQEFRNTVITKNLDR